MAQILAQVKLGTVTDIDLTQALTIGNTRIDGVIVNVGDRILVKSQTDRKENGIYRADTSGSLIRVSEFENGSVQTPSTVIFIQQGAQLADTGWVLASDSNTDTLVVGSAELEFVRFSVNLNILGADLPSNIVLRSEKGYPLTNNELDNNFKFLAISLAQKLNIADFTQTAICDRINSVNYSVANIDANKLHGFTPTSEYINNTQSIVLRAQNGNVSSPTFTGDLIGNADTADVATLALTAHALDQVNPVHFGGTGSSTAEGARLNLNIVNRAGDSMTGKLSLSAANGDHATLNIPPQTASINTPLDGDIWTSATQMFYHLSGNTYTLAPLQSPTFTGTPNTPTAEKTSNSTAIASTQFVQYHVTDINAALALKAPLTSPLLTGDPRAPTPPTSDNDTTIATTAFVVNKFNSIMPGYYTKLEANAIHNAESANRISSDNGLSARIDDLAKMRGIPIGSVIYYAASNQPVGWLKCDGSLVSKTAFPQLFSKIGYTYGGAGNDFRLPDLRGEFLRGWDDGRGVDGARAFGSWQKGTMVGGYDDDDASSHSSVLQGRRWNTYGSDLVTSEIAYNIYSLDKIKSSIPSGETIYNIAQAPNWVSITRPRNIAMMPCIKAFGDIDDPDLINATSVLESIAYKVDRRGDVMSGRLTLSADPINDLHAATKQYVDTAITRVDNRVAKAGDSMTGFLYLSSNPTQPMHAATKDYVDTLVKSRPIVLSLDTRGLNTSEIAAILNIIAPPSNYLSGTEARITSTSQNVTTSHSVVKRPWISITYVSSVSVTTTVNNPTRNSNLLFVINSSNTSWVYVSG